MLRRTFHTVCQLYPAGVCGVLVFSVLTLAAHYIPYRMYLVRGSVLDHATLLCLLALLMAVIAGIMLPFLCRMLRSETSVDLGWWMLVATAGILGLLFLTPAVSR